MINLFKRTRLQVYAIVILWLFVNSAMLNLNGAPMIVLYTFLLGFIVKGEKRRRFFELMLITILLDDIFEYDLGFISFTKGVCATTCMELFNASFVLYFWILISSKKLIFFTGKMGSIGFILILIIIWSVITSITSRYELFEVVSNNFRFVQFFLFFLVCVDVLSEKEDLLDLMSHLYFFVVTGFVIGVIPFLTGRVNQTFAGSLLIFALPLVGGVIFNYINHSGFRGKWIYLMILIGGMIPLLMSDSRRNLIALGAVGVFMFFKLRLYRKPVVLILTISILYLVGNSFISESFNERIAMSTKALNQIYERGNIDSDLATDFYTGRDRLFDYAIEEIIENPISGIGLEMSYTALEERIGEKVRPHNFYYQFAMETGLVGLFLYFTLIVVYVIGLLRSRRRLINSPRTFIFLIGFIEGLLFFILVAHFLAFFGLYMMYDKFYWFLLSLGPAIGFVTKQYAIEMHSKPEKTQAVN